MKNGEDHMIRSLRSGRESAYDKLFRDYYRPLSVFAVKYVSDLDLAREIVQNLFVHLYETRSSLVILANLGSWPVVYFVTKQWLQSFPYKVAPSIVPYVAAMALTMIIAYGSMLYHTYKASQINPADSLRHE